MRRKFIGITLIVVVFASIVLILGPIWLEILYKKPIDQGPEPEEEAQDKTPEVETETQTTGGGAGTGGEGGAPGTPTAATPPGNQLPSALLGFDNFEYQIINSNLARVTSIAYTIQSGNTGDIHLDLLIYIYGPSDSSSIKGLVREEISIGTLSANEPVSETRSVTANYLGDLSGTKTIELKLIGNLQGTSFTLASATKDVLFS